VISAHTLEVLLTMFMKVVQTELTKIAKLKANILQMHLAFKELTILAMESILDDLKGWQQPTPTQSVKLAGSTGWRPILSYPKWSQDAVYPNRIGC
jgi:hypothetical protein